MRRQPPSSRINWRSKNVVIATNNSPQLPGNGDIFVNASINWASNNSLTLSAYRNINIAAM
jgi:hypothetical protein